MYVEDLVDASDTIDFQEKVEKVFEKWRNMSMLFSRFGEIHFMVFKSQGPSNTRLHASISEGRVWPWFTSKQVHH